MSSPAPQHSTLKPLLLTPLRAWFRATARIRSLGTRLLAHARLAAALRHPLPSSVVVLGDAQVHGTGNIRFGEDALLYPGVYLETEDEGEIVLGRGVVLSTGVHLVARSRIELGDGVMIGEYASLRDANHTREPGVTLRDSAHATAPIVLGREVWIGRGVTVLPGVSIGDGATVGANAVVTRDVAAGATVGGVPAVPLRKRT